MDYDLTAEPTAAMLSKVCFADLKSAGNEGPEDRKLLISKLSPDDAVRALIQQGMLTPLERHNVIESFGDRQVYTALIAG